MRELTEKEIELFDSQGVIPALRAQKQSNMTVRTTRSTMRPAAQHTRKPRWARAIGRSGAVPA